MTDTSQAWEHYSSIRNLDGPHHGIPDVKEKALSVAEERRQKEKLSHVPHVLPWMVDVVSSSLPYLADKSTIKRMLEECKGDINAAVDRLLGAEENGSQSSTQSSAQESSSVEREPDSDEEYQRGPSKKQNRRPARSKRSSSAQILSKLATHNDSEDSLSSEHAHEADPASAQTIKAESGLEEQPPIKPDTSEDRPCDLRPKPKIRIKLKPPNPPPKEAVGSNGRTHQKQQGPQRETARDKKDIKKQAQKAARKERQQAAIKAGPGDDTVKNGVALRTQGVNNTPPIESGFRTLFI